MTQRRRGVVIVGFVALLALSVAGVAAASMLSGGNPASDQGAQSADGEVDYCPTEAELRAYWEENGEELKPTIDCEYASNPKPPDDLKPEPDDVEPGSEPTSMAEALKLFDPTDDPSLVIGQKANGDYYGEYIVVDGEIPDWVKTAEDVQAWSDQLRAEYEQESK